MHHCHLVHGHSNAIHLFQLWVKLRVWGLLLRMLKKPLCYFTAGIFLYKKKEKEIWETFERKSKWLSLLDLSSLRRVNGELLESNVGFSEIKHLRETHHAETESPPSDTDGANPLPLPSCGLEYHSGTCGNRQIKPSAQAWFKTNRLRSFK